MFVHSRVAVVAVVFADAMEAPTMVLASTILAFVVGVLAGVLAVYACGRSTSTSSKTKPTAAIPSDARASTSVDLPVGDVWVSVAGERWHLDPKCRGLRVTSRTRKVSACLICAKGDSKQG